MLTVMEEELLMAHVDGELDALTADRVAKALAGDADLRKVAEAQRRLRECLAEHYAPVADEEVPERFRAMLETNVVPLTGRVQWRPVLGWRAAGAVAASFAVGLIAAQMIPERPMATGVTGDRLIAAGPLARMLDTRLASEQTGAEPTRIGVTFAAKDGRLCRTFESRDMAGLACREREGWHVVTSAAARPASGGEYRQAASGTAFVMRVSQDLMKGEPFDARAEREARDTGWPSRR
jgi:anti-sigma factor RsiW